MKEKRKVPCEVYSRVVGYYRPVQGWNVGKKQEFEDRVVYSTGKELPGEESDSLASDG